MNARNQDLPNVDEETLDLLVDGELTDDNRRRLLARLDDVPGGWRRCALAFLEAQSWKTSLGLVARPVVDRPETTCQSRNDRWFPGNRWATMLAMAASFLIALGIGLVWRNGRSTVAPPAGTADLAAATTEQPGLQPLVDPAVPKTALAENVPQQATPTSPWQLVSVPVAGGPDGRQSIQLPAVERNRLDDHWIENTPSAIPPDVLQALLRAGHQVRQDRRLMPVEMDDGRRLVVPVDQVELRYVGNRSYQ